MSIWSIQMRRVCHTRFGFGRPCRALTSLKRS